MVCALSIHHTLKKGKRQCFKTKLEHINGLTINMMFVIKADLCIYIQIIEHIVKITFSKKTIELYLNLLSFLYSNNDTLD